jgi:signal transduction histidine kinase
MSAKILIVDDDERILQTFARHLRLEGYTVLTTSNGAEAIQLFSQERPEVVFADVRMPPPDGLEVLRAIRKEALDAEVILITGHGDMELAIQALRSGASDFIPKPIATEMLEAALHRIWERVRLKQELRAAQAALQQYAVDLEMRNADLEAYNYTVAHDLKLPLNSITHYADMLRTHYPMSEEMYNHLNAIVRNGHTMGRIVDELLLLSQVRQMEVELQPLDMGRIVGEVQQRLSQLIVQHQAKVILPNDWPVALGYAPWVEEVWANYLSNALEYGAQPPRVQLGATARSDGMIRFWVREKSNGLTPEGQAQLLTPLVRADQLPPTGRSLGLSIIQRIVQKLGGQVGTGNNTVAGQENIFCFTLKAAAPISDLR